MYIPRLRKIPHAVREIKEQDKNSAITEYLLQELIRQGELSQMKYGNAWLVNLDELAYYFKSKENHNEEDDNRWNL